MSGTNECQVPISGTYPVELLLEFLIGVVNTELLKAIPVKSLKPINDQKKRLTKQSYMYIFVILLIITYKITRTHRYQELL